MPVLAAWIGNLLGSIAGFFGQYFSKRLAVGLAVVIAFTASTAIFIAALNAAVLTISVVVPSEITIAASWVVPSNSDECLAAIITAKLASWVYYWQVKVIQYKLAI
jgi:uncharacterized protein DUF5455